MNTHDPVAEYYDYTLPFYKVFWHGESRGVHYGYWDAGTKTLQDSIERMNTVLAEAVRIRQDDVVLDAGCGVGGSAIWLVKNIGCHVTGITISAKQVQKAEELAARHNVSGKTQFLVRDYLQTGLPDAAYTVVWGLESMCYAQDRADALAREMYRILKPGGRIVVADGFRGADILDARAERLLGIFQKGFVLPNLITSTAFAAALTRAGFRDVHMRDITANILPTAKKMWQLCTLAYPASRVTGALGLTKPLLTQNNRTGFVQRELFERRSLVYALVYAEK